jgi:DNA-binding CsgD family transcriptional regulator
MSSDYNTVLKQVILSNSVSDAILKIGHLLELGHVTYHMAYNPDDTLDNPYVRTTYSPEWVSYYLLNNLAATDPVVKHGFDTTDPFFWDELPATEESLDIFNHAAKFDIFLLGYSVPYTDPKGRQSLFSVTARESTENWKEHIKNNAHSIHQLAYDIHIKAISEIYISGDIIPQLAPREMECLRWSAQGKTYAEMAIILGLSEHTVRSYLKSVRLRLDCVSLAQAVSKASKMKII